MIHQTTVRRARAWVISLGVAAMLLAWLFKSSWLSRTSPTAVQAADVDPRLAGKNEFLQNGPFIQIPGPNPIVVRGGKGAWDENVIEACDAFEDFGTYYLYYHGVGKDKNSWPNGYRIGLATASHPLGPWKKHGDKPLLDLGPVGSWEDEHVACAMIVKVGLDKYYMWYSGRGRSEQHQKWSVGLATASSPLGPWKKHEGNPVLEDFGYVGGVVFVKGKYYLYAEHPIGSTGPDYGPMALATADAPGGPWTKWHNNPVLAQGGWGSWDDGGFSEAEVVLWDGVFHIFYGGAKLYKPRMLTRESIGYAHSFDGYTFTKYGRNPVATREANPNAAAFSEVHSLFEPPFIYLYHTLRYKKPNPADEKDFPNSVEDLGVQVLAMQTPFRVAMPVLILSSLGPKASSSLDACPPLALSNIARVSLTTECTYPATAKTGIRVHVRASYDGLNYDSTDSFTLDHEVKPGQTMSKTVELDTRVKFIKVRVENLDAAQSVADVKITATLGS